jgi:hypothetical protein
LDAIAHYLKIQHFLEFDNEDLRRILEEWAIANIDLKLHEKQIQIALWKQLGGQVEVETPAGRIDLLTDTEIIEIKRAKNWKAAIGQVISYAMYFPDRQKRVHLFDKVPLNTFDTIARSCRENQIKLSYESDD